MQDPWLRSAQHGALGEARIRALLLERFWVLERSVDVDGADYLVQLRPRSLARLLDEPVRLGRVQAKFVADDDQYVYVPERYVRDEAGEPWAQFFLLVASGEVDAERLYLLTATDIAQTFALGGGSHATDFSLAAKTIFRAGRYGGATRRPFLDTIERALLEADRGSYARFFGQTRMPARLDIDPEFTLPLPNSWGPFAPTLREIKDHVETTIFDMEDVLDVLHRIVASGSPVEVEDLLDEQAIYDHRGQGDELGFSLRDVRKEDFFGEARRYRERVARLRSSGLEEAYLRAAADIAREVQRLLVGQGETPEGDTLEWTLRFEPATLQRVSLSCALVKRPPPPGTAPWQRHFGEIEPEVSHGQIRIVRGLPPFPPDPPMFRPWEREKAAAWRPPSWSEFVSDKHSCVSDSLLALLEEVTFPDDDL